MKAKIKKRKKKGGPRGFAYLKINDPEYLTRLAGMGGKKKNWWVNKLKAK